MATTLPDVATVAETIPGLESASWQGLFVPANTPREIAMTIQRETAKALRATDLIERALRPAATSRSTARPTSSAPGARCTRKR